MENEADAQSASDKAGNVSSVRARTPWHIWVVGIISLMWNAGGANDYYQTQTGNPDYIESAADSMGVSAQQMLAYAQGFPAWVDGFWALGVWGAVAGSFLMLLRSRFAVWAFGGSLIGLAGTSAYHALTDQPEWATGGMSTLRTVAIWSIATFLLIYAYSMRNKGLLR